MCKIKNFICDPVSLTKNCDLFKQKQNIELHITMLVIYNVILKTYSCVKKLNKNKTKILHIQIFKLVRV